MITINSVQSLLERIGAVLAACLLIKFSVDFSFQPGWLAVPLLPLVFGSILVLGYNIFGRASAKDIQRGPRNRSLLVLLALVPAGFLASSLGCSGLALHGCSPFCTFIKLAWVPALGVFAVLYYLRPSPRLLLFLTAMCFVPLYPHCVCRNVANAWWIDRFGASLQCYVWGFTAALIALTGARRGTYVWHSLAMSGIIVAGSLTFFVGHHYFKFPW